MQIVARHRSAQRFTRSVSKPVLQRQLNPSHKKAPDGTGASVVGRFRKSVTGGNRRTAEATEAVVEPQGDHIDVLVDSIGRTDER